MHGIMFVIYIDMLLLVDCRNYNGVVDTILNNSSQWT